MPHWQTEATSFTMYCARACYYGDGGDSQKPQTNGKCQRRCRGAASLAATAIVHFRVTSQRDVRESSEARAGTCEVFLVLVEVLTRNFPVLLDLVQTQG